MSIYKSQFTGAEIEEALKKAKQIEQDSNGFYKVDSNEDEPADLNDLIGLGNYTIYYFMNGHEDWEFVRPINITTCLIDDILTQVVILVDKIYSRKLINDKWLPWSFASLSTSFFISDTEPVEKELNNVWIDTSDSEIFSMYISNGTKFIPVQPIGMMSKDIYDTEGKNTDIFKYADEKTMEIISKTGGLNIYDLLTAHENNTDVHITDTKRKEWNAKETPENATTKINQALTDLKSYSDSTNSGFSETLATLASEIKAVAGLLTAHKENSAIHVTSEKETYWNNKSDANHTHNLDGRVKVSASNVVGGVFDISQIPDGAKERLIEVASDAERFKLTIKDVQNGDMVAVKKTADKDASLYIVIDEKNLNNESGYREAAYGNNRSARWENVIERPTTVVGYGITDAYTKSDITKLHDELHQTILNETDDKITALNIPALEKTIGTHILNKDVHTSTAEKAKWSNKADGNHTHLNDGRVTVQASNIVGTIPLDRIPKGAIEEIVFVRDDAERFALTTDKAQKGDLVSVGGTFIPRDISITANVSEAIYFSNNLYLVRGTEFIFPGNKIVQIPKSTRIRFKYVNATLFLLLDAMIYKVNVTAKTLEVVCQNSSSVPDIDYWNNKYYVYYNKGLWVGTGTTVASMTQIANIAFDEMILVVSKSIFAMITKNKLYRLQADHTYVDSGNLTFAPKYAFFFDGKFVIYGASKMATYNSVAITETSYTVNVPATFNIVCRGSYLLLFNNTNEMFISRDGIAWKRHAFKIGNNVNTAYQQGSVYYIPSSTGLTQFEFNSTIFDTSTVYYIIDESQMNNENGYSLYSIGAADSVKWGNITEKPTTLAGYGIEDVYTKSETDTVMHDAVNEANAKMEDIKTDVNDILRPANTKLNSHIDDAELHTTPEKIAKWDGKAESNHTHKAGDGTVEIDGSQITSGTIDLERLPNDALERVIRVLNDAERFSLTKNEAQNGDTIVVEDAGYEMDTISMGIVAEDILMAYGNGYYVAVPTKGYYGAYSEDLMNWTQFDIISNPTEVYEWTHIIFYNESFLLFRKNFDAYYLITVNSFDQPRTWVSPNKDERITDIFKGANNTLCVLCNSRMLYEFPNMDLTLTPIKHNLSKLGSQILAGYYVESSGYYLYQDADNECIIICDGITSKISSFELEDLLGYSIKFCEAGGLVFAIDVGGIWTSFNGGYTWEINNFHRPDAETELCKIVHGNVNGVGLYVTAGPMYGVTYIATSTDGLTWKYTRVEDLDGCITSVCYGNQKFIMVEQPWEGPGETRIHWSWDGTKLYKYDLDIIHNSSMHVGEIIFYNNCYYFRTAFGVSVSGDGLQWTKLSQSNMAYPASMLVSDQGVFISSDNETEATVVQFCRNKSIEIEIDTISFGNLLGKTTFKAVGLSMTGFSSSAIVAMASKDEHFIYIMDGGGIKKSSKTVAALYNVTGNPVDILTVMTATGPQLAILLENCLLVAKFTSGATGIETTFTKVLTTRYETYLKISQSRIKQNNTLRPVYLITSDNDVKYAQITNDPTWNSIDVPTVGYSLKNIIFNVNRVTGEQQGMLIMSGATNQYFRINSNNTVSPLNAPTSIVGNKAYYLNGYFISVQSSSSSFIYSSDLKSFNMADIEFYDKFQTLDTSGTYVPSLVDNMYIICGHTSSKYYILDNNKNSKLRSMHFERIHNGGRQISKCNNKYIKPVNTNAIISTIDGYQWKDSVTSLPNITQQTSIYVFGYYFIAGYSSTILYSKDGDTWLSFKMPLTLPTYCFNSMTLFRNKLYMTTSVAGGTSVDYIISSTDGFNWKKEPLPVSSLWYCLVSGNGILALISDYPTTGIMYTTDGSDWKFVTMESIIKQVGLTYGGPPNIHTACTCGNTFFFPTYQGYYVYTTTDFITWKYIKLPVIDRWQCVSNNVDEVIFTGRAYCIRLRIKNTRIYIVEDDTKLNSEDGYLDYSVSPSSGPFYWESISNTPATISGYGIMDAYTKSEVDKKISTVHDSVDNKLSTTIKENESQIRANLANNTSQLTTIKASIATIENASAVVIDTKNKLTVYSANIDSIYNAIKESEIILTNIDTIL